MESIIAGTFGLLIGLGGLWTGFRQLRNRAVLNRWPVTKGKVIERGTYQPNMVMPSAPAFRHAPLVRYVYQVDGQEFINDRIRPQRMQLPEHNTLKWAEKRAASFPDEVTVYYNPDDPRESFLVLTAKGWLYAVLGASCLALLFGLLWLLPKLVGVS
jgi:hypothetical protein